MNIRPPWMPRSISPGKSLAAVLLLLAVAVAQPGLMAQTPTPTISELKPDEGRVGDNVQIKGSNFGSSKGTVTFNGTEASIASSDWEDNKIKTSVPAGATDGPVVVTTSGGQASAGVNFDVTPTPTTPTIDKLEPATGPVGTEVKIKGLNFGETQGSVTFNGVSASSIEGWNDKKVRAVVPSTATTGSVVVTTSGGTASNGVTFTVTLGTPSISKLEPNEGPVLTQVKIKGSNFGDQTGSVTFNGTMASTSRWNHDIIHTQVPSGATTGNVVVTNSANKSSSGTTFTVTNTPAPSISKLDPTSGPVNTSVTIEGSNFGSSAGSVTFNGTTATTTSWDTDEIETSVPSGATTGAVVVTTSGGQSSTGVTFTVTTPAPSISSLDPTSGPVNTTVTIEGSNFGSSGTVTFNGTTASTSSWGSAEIETTVPSGATTGPVVVTTGGQSSRGVTFTVTTPAPSISRLDPSSGLIGAGVTIEGSNFGTSTGTVTFNGTTASTSRWGTAEIETTVPSGATSGNVVVTTSGGQASAGVAFTVNVPSISRLDPSSGLIGASVTIEGSNFGSSAGTVTFNGTTASTSSWGTAEIETTVPSGATSGNVVVTTSGGQASAGVAFTVNVPSISNLDPSSGLIGASVTIEGSNFGSSTGTVTFNGTTASTSSWGAAEIETTVPSGATSGNVVVTTSGGQASAGVAFTVNVPSISNLDPSSGLVGASVTIEGSNFGSSTGTVTFNGTTASTSSWGAAEIETTVPSGATSGNVVVTTSGGQASSGVNFTVSVPSISKLDPSSGHVGASVTIEGSNFGTSSGSVTFNGTSASTSSWGTDEIETTVPSGATSGNVVVTTSGGQASAGVNFTVTVPDPAISSLDPTSGPVDTEVRIQGTNFGSQTGSVTFNGESASPDHWEDQLIRVRVPDGATDGPVVVTTSAGKSSAGVNFTVTAPPAGPIISRLDPNSGLVDTEVTIHGSNFGSSGTVTFNGTAASTSSWDTDEIETTVPTGATTGVVIVTVDGKSSAGVTFTVIPPAPVISRLDPDSGPVDTEVTIHGSNFGSSGTVTFNGTSASTSSWDTDEIQATVPDGATTGLVVVTVGTQSSSGVAFTVTIPPPVISRLDPDSGPFNAEVTIHGSNFGTSGTVTFNGTTASTFSWGDNRIRTRVPDGATTGPVVVTVGTESSAGVTFTVTTLIISRLDPDSGPVDTEVRIHGSNFGNRVGTVTFNGVSSSPIQWNDRTIRVRVPVGATTGPVVVTVGDQSSAGITFTVTESDLDRDPGNPADFSASDLTGTSFTLYGTRLDGSVERVTVHFLEGNRFEAAGPRTGSYEYRPTGSSTGTLTLEYDGGGSCEVELTLDSVNSGTSIFDCSSGASRIGRFRLTAGTTFVPVLLTAAGRNNSFFTSEMTLTNRGTREARLHYTYRAHTGGGTGSASEVLPAGHQRVVPNALAHLRSLGIPIPAEGKRIGTLRVEAPVASEVGVLVRTTTDVPDGRAGLAYAGIGMEEGFHQAVYLCGLRQNQQDRSNVAFQNMGAPEDGPIVLRTTVFSGDPYGPAPPVLEEKELKPGGFYQFSRVLGSVANGYVRVERVDGSAPFYAYGVINDQVNSDGSFVFPVVESFPGDAAGQTVPVIVETSNFTSELTVTNFSGTGKTVNLSYVEQGMGTTGVTVNLRVPLAAGEQSVLPELAKEIKRTIRAGNGSSGDLAGPLFASEADGNLEGVVVAARTVAPALVAGGQYGVYYTAAPHGTAFSREAWVEGLQQNQESRSNLALVNTGEVDDTESVFSLDIYDGDTGMLVTTITGRTVPARGWRQLNGILLNYAQGSTHGYVRIRKIDGNNPFLAYGVINDGGSPGERSGDGAYIPARE